MIDENEPSDARNRFTWRTFGVCATLSLRRDPHPKALIAARIPRSSLAKEHHRSGLVHLRLHQGRVHVLYDEASARTTFIIGSSIHRREEHFI